MSDHFYIEFGFREKRTSEKGRLAHRGWKKDIKKSTSPKHWRWGDG